MQPIVYSQLSWWRDHGCNASAHEEVYLRRQVELNPGGGEDGEGMQRVSMKTSMNERCLNTLHVGAQITPVNA